MRNRLLSAGEAAAGWLAMDLPVYRELYSRGLSFLAGLAGVPKQAAELILRGKTYRRLSGGQRIRVGRHVEFIEPRRISLGGEVCLYGFDYLDASGPKGSIRIGERSHIDQFCVLYGQGGLEIGRFCAIASGVKIYSQSNQYREDPGAKTVDQPVVYRAVAIGDDVWIGANAVILPGVRVGAGAVIGAGSVVKEDVPPGAVAVGSPARVVSMRHPA